MTGKYPARIHLTDFIDGGLPPRNSPIGYPDWQKYLPLEEITIAEALKQEGYKTAFFGKWHFCKEKMPLEACRSIPLSRVLTNILLPINRLEK